MMIQCSELSVLTTVEQQNHAFHLSLTALLGKDIYDFGEFLAHPILSALSGTKKECLLIS